MTNVIAKIWAQILAERMQKEVEEKRILPDSQSGFRKNRSTLDNIYILDAITNDRRGKNKKTYVMFIDLKAAFDTVDRDLLWKMLEKYHISPELINCCREMYRITPMEIGNIEFFTTMGVKQGCPLSPILFAIYMSDLDEKLRRAQAGGVTMGKKKVFTLAYADDMALLADNPVDLREMCRILEGFLSRKRLELNVGKTKILTVSSGGRLSKEEWKWKGENLEEVKEFSYLGYVFASNGKVDAHIRTMKEGAMKKLGEVWGIGERRFPNNFLLRMEMFDILIASGMLYGTEICGWNDMLELERVHRKFIKWTLNVNQSTSSAILYVETGRMPLHLETARRAMRYEERIKRIPNALLREALIIQRRKPVRVAFLERAGWNQDEQLLRWMEGGPRWIEACDARYEETRAQLLTEASESWYGKLMSNHLPKYLEDGIEIKTIARFRLGCEERGRDKWRPEKDKMCRICGTEEETVEHLMMTCCPSERPEEEILGDRGQGLPWMKSVLYSREI